jgi:hypothetical protein
VGWNVSGSRNSTPPDACAVGEVAAEAAPGSVALTSTISTLHIAPRAFARTRILPLVGLRG